MEEKRKKLLLSRPYSLTTFNLILLYQGPRNVSRVPISLKSENRGGGELCCPAFSRLSANKKELLSMLAEKRFK